MAVRILDHPPGDPPVLSGETGDHKNMATMSRAVILDIESYIQTLLFRRPTVLKVEVTGCAEYVNPRGRWWPQPTSIVTLEKWNESSNSWVRVTPVPPLNYNDEMLLDVGVWRISVIQGLVASGDALPPEIKWAIQHYGAYLRDMKPLDGTRTPLIHLSGASTFLRPHIRTQARPLRTS